MFGRLVFEQSMNNDDRIIFLLFVIKYKNRLFFVFIRSNIYPNHIIKFEIVHVVIQINIIFLFYNIVNTL